jgi:type IV pilus assembly protein PilA
MKNMKKGFTLIELIVVIAIIAILALILVPQVTGYIDDANRSADRASAKACYTSALAVWTTGEAGLTESTVKVDSECSIDSGTGTYAWAANSDAPAAATFDGVTYTASTNSFS